MEMQISLKRCYPGVIFFSFRPQQPFLSFNRAIFMHIDFNYVICEQKEPNLFNTFTRLVALVAVTPYPGHGNVLI